MYAHRFNEAAGCNVFDVSNVDNNQNRVTLIGKVSYECLSAMLMTPLSVAILLS